MNKLILALLVVCAIAAQSNAFVKRDAAAAPAASDNNIDKVFEQIKEFATNAQQKLSENFNPDKVKEDLQKLQKQIEEGFASLTAKKEEKA